MFTEHCLDSIVYSIDSKVYRGNESDTSGAASLRIHDMILSMNGKPLGGMTELGVAIEFDVCGREMELVVARYRDSAGVTEQVAAIERREWTAFDDAVNDKRRLDWYEMNGNSSVAAKSLPTIDMLQTNDLTPFDFRQQDNGFDPGIRPSMMLDRPSRQSKFASRNSTLKDRITHRSHNSRLLVQDLWRGVVKVIFANDLVARMDAASSRKLGRKTTTHGWVVSVAKFTRNRSVSFGSSVTTASPGTTSPQSALVSMSLKRAALVTFSAVAVRILLFPSKQVSTAKDQQVKHRFHEEVSERGCQQRHEAALPHRPLRTSALLHR